MITFIFIILLLCFVGKMIAFAFKAAWGITKISFAIIFFPIFIIAVFLSGLVYVAIAVLLIAGLVSLIGSIVK